MAQPPFAIGKLNSPVLDLISQMQSTNWPANPFKYVANGSDLLIGGLLAAEVFNNVGKDFAHQRHRFEVAMIRPYGISVRAPATSQAIVLGVIVATVRNLSVQVPVVCDSANAKEGRERRAGTVGQGSYRPEWRAAYARSFPGGSGFIRSEQNS